MKKALLLLSLLTVFAMAGQKMKDWVYDISSINLDRSISEENMDTNPGNVSNNINSSTSNANCNSPSDQGVKDINSNEATIYWDDTSGTKWEYIIQLPSDPYPTGISGITSTVKETRVTKDHTGNNLQPDTEYEFYVRTDCGINGFSDWLGPYNFKTLCASVTLPFKETFNTDSPTRDCWVIVDGNEDDDFWDFNGWSQYEGSHCMAFSTYNNEINDDWLISPSIAMTTNDIFEVAYYIKTSSSGGINNKGTEFEILLSDNGIDIANFKTILQTKQSYKYANYVKKTIYITGINGSANIAWHITSDGPGSIFLDLITITKVDCLGPKDEIVISNLEKDKATFSWADDNNTSWEYYVQHAGTGTPTGSGTLTTTKSANITRTNGTGGANLQPNTEYEFWLRSSCGPGKNSNWIGPIVFRTPCDISAIPFWEGFNTNSPTLNCWTIIDYNNDNTGYGNIWELNDWEKYEGDRSMYFNGGYEAGNDDWLISPPFNLDATKIYKLKYHYRTDSYSKTDFKVALSTSGISPSDFTDILVTKKGESNGKWKEEITYIGGISGNINIGWHVNTNTSSTLYVDNVFLEEETCPQPIQLGSKDEKKDSATIIWKDDFGSKWEYVLQLSGGNPPVSNGTTSTSKEVVVTKDQKGNVLEPNTEYEFYVRTDCGNTEFSEWAGPYKFRTICDFFTTPFWEGFNSDSQSFFCWTILDNNSDGRSGSGQWEKSNYGQYEGSHGMYFSVNDYMGDIESDDWLISPVFTFTSGKMYRLKYHYNTNSYNDSNEFEVLASTSGIKPVDFTTEIVKSKIYTNDNYIEQKTFISGLSGNVNIAWHIKGTGDKTIYIDNVFVEEVTGCPEPLDLDAKDIDKRDATISWTDDFGATNWEYIVQKEGEGIPSGSGTATTTKENKITKDHSGGNLAPNTDYEFYVRTNCGNGEYSIWAGPFKFVTLCDIYTVPFWEGFNSDSKTLRCWTIIDNNDDEYSWEIDTWDYYEGDQSINMNIYDWLGTTENDDWLVSPTFAMTSGNYVLKYFYKGSAYEGGNVEVLLSKNGVDPKDFTDVIVADEIYYNNNWKEKVVFFSGIPGNVNLAWHTKVTGDTSISIDNVSLKKIETCPEPYYIKVTGQTSNSIDIEWEQDGGITSWEVIVVEYNEEETATPIQTVSVTGSPKTTITGLPAGKAYTIYVRAKCSDGKSNSEWSTPVDGGTSVGANDDCIGAINIPVSNNEECEIMISGSLLDTTTSAQAIPSCIGWGGMENDVWFEFTATNKTHILNIENLISLSGESNINLVGAIYDQPCSTIGNTAIECFDITDFKLFENLTVGQKYYIRLGSDSFTDNPDYFFNLCISTVNYIRSSSSGDEYTVEELVNDVLVNSNCDLVSNITYITGTNFGEENGIGYFNKNNSTFNFDDGIILATNGVRYAMGPGGSDEGWDTENWLGDDDLEKLLLSLGQEDGNNNASVLEFDFIPVVDTLKFDFIFASNEYGPSFQCDYSDVFAFFLTDLTTNETINLAVLPGTDIPVSVTTIRDAKYQGKNLKCGDTNKEYFDKYYGENGLKPQNNPINYAGMTIPLTAVSAVEPGRKYHIKLAIADYRDSGVNSAVFLKGGSFNLGNIDLGADLLVETGNAICSDEVKIIKSGMPENDNITIEWYKDDVLIQNENKPDLEIKESGEYKIVVKYADLGCEVTGTVKAEIYPPISKVVHKPITIEICRFSLNERTVDLSSTELDMFADVERTDYEVDYYLTKEDAEQGNDNKINTSYTIEGTDNINIYLRIVDTRTGCSEIFILPILIEQGAIPTKPSDIKICSEYVFPEVNGDQYYYTESGGQGKEYKVGDVLTEPGKHTIYLLQVNNDEGCYEETIYHVDITAPVIADIFEDQQLKCQLYELKPLSGHNRYFTKSGGPQGLGTEYFPGMEISSAETIYVYASSNDDLCTDESSFTITYEDCPIPKGISPNGDNLNDTFDLSLHGVENIKIYNRWGTEVYSHGIDYTNQWYGQNKDGKQLPDGTYYYIIQAHGKTRTGWVQINK